MTTEKLAGVEKILAVFKKLLDPTKVADFPDEWLQALCDACSLELYDEEITAKVLRETDFLYLLLELACWYGGDVSSWTLKDENAKIETRSYPDARYDHPADHRYFAVVSRIFFSLLRHSECVRLLRFRYFVEPNSPEAPSETLSALDFFVKLASKDSCREDPLVFSAVCSTLKSVVSTEDCFQWLVEETSLFRSALNCLLDSAGGPGVPKPTYYCRREATAFLVAAIRARAANSDLRLFVDILLALTAAHEPTNSSPSKSFPTVLPVKVLFECLQSAFLEAENTPEMMREIASVVRVYHVREGADEETSMRGNILLFLLGDEDFSMGGGETGEAGGSCDGNTGGFCNSGLFDNQTEYDKITQHFHTCVSSVHATNFCKKNCYLPVALLSPIMVLDPNDARFETSSSWSPNALTKAVLRACRTLIVSLEKGLRVEKDEEVRTSVLRILKRCLTEPKWTPHAFTITNEERIRKALCGVVSRILIKRSDAPSTSEITSLAEVLLEMPSLDVNRSTTGNGIGCTEMKSRLNCLLACLTVVHHRQCRTASLETPPVDLESWLSKLVTTSLSAADKDEGWENSDSIAEFYMQLFDELNSCHERENGFHGVSCEFFPLLEGRVFLGLAKFARETSQRYRGPASSNVRATALAALASLTVFRHLHDQKLEQTPPQSSDLVGYERYAGENHAADGKEGHHLVVEDVSDFSNVDDENCDLKGRKAEIAQGLKIIDTMISLTSMNKETEAVVRRGAIDALTRTLDLLFDRFTFGDEERQSTLAKVVTAVANASFADFDFDVKRKCVSFWKAFALRLIYQIDVNGKANRSNDVDGEHVELSNPEAVPQVNFHKLNGSDGEEEVRIFRESLTETNGSVNEFVDKLLGTKAFETASDKNSGCINMEGSLAAVYKCLFLMAKYDCEPCVQTSAGDALRELPSTNQQTKSFKAEIAEGKSDSPPSPLLILDEVFKEVQNVPLQHVRFGDLDENMIDCY